MTITITLRMPEAVLRRYARAARRVRRNLSAASPTTEQLMVHALTERVPPETAGRKQR